MTSGAQQALRRTMEISSNSTRFALACNTSSKVIEPIQSRCALVRFSRLTKQEILSRLMAVVAAEKVDTDPSSVPDYCNFSIGSILYLRLIDIKFVFSFDNFIRCWTFVNL